MDEVAAWFLALYKTTGIKLTIFYDAYDRGRFVEGFLTTVKLSAYCLVLSLLFGAFVAMLQGSRIALVRRAASAFVEVFRNTPPLVQLYFFYFALGPLLPRLGGVPALGSFGWAVVSLTLLETAFAAEIYRAGIEAVPKAMVEAAASLGFSRPQIYRQVVLPLALRVAVLFSVRTGIALFAVFFVSLAMAQVATTRTQPSVFDLLVKWTPLLATGFLFNLAISFFAMTVGTAAGVLLGIARISLHPSLRGGSWLVVQFFRNAPWLVLLF